MKLFSVFTKTTFTIFLITSIIACDKKEETNNADLVCNVSNPIQELNWLSEKINANQHDEYYFVVKALYNGETVFYSGNCNPAINYASILQNCEGERLGLTNEFQNELTEKVILWKHENSQCNFD